MSFLRAGRHGRPDRFADQITAALDSGTFGFREYLVRVVADSMRLAALQLLAIVAQRRVWEERIGLLLLGDRRIRRTVAEDQPGQAFPDGEIYLSFPGLGDRLAARA